MKRFWILSGVLMALMYVAFPGDVLASSVEELERRMDILTEELQEMKNETAIADTGYASAYGLGPAASKVYRTNRGISIGGYGEGHFSKLVDDQGDEHDVADALRAILYVGYKFSDRIVLNTEIEIEHADEIFLEMASLDFMLHEKFNLRTGLLLTPVGITNELHEPTLFHGNDRPYVERQVIPSTWREMGVGAFGRLTEKLEYKLYVMNGLRGSAFTSKGLRGGRQKGSKALADDWALVGSLGWEPLLGVNLGGSVYLGNSDQNEVVDASGNEVDLFTEIYEIHGQYQKAGLELKALASLVQVEDSEAVGAPEEIVGWYTEVAYDVLPLLAKGTSQYLAPFYRFEDVDYTGTSEDLNLHTVGISYKPIPNVVLKADYRNFDKAQGSVPDEVNFGFGYIF